MTRQAIVVGAGLAGAGVALLLAKAGRDVLLLEREAGPHDKVCGEFLSFEAVDSLRRMGVDPIVLGAKSIDHLAVCKGRRRTVARLPFNALSLSRRMLDEALIEEAVAAGAQLRRGVRVTELEAAARGWLARTSDGQTLVSDHLFLATGKHDLRGFKRPPGKQPNLIGFKTYLRLSPAVTRRLEGVVELHLFPAGYAGLQLIEGDRANLCLVIKKEKFSCLGGRWESLLAFLMDTCPFLAADLQGAQTQLQKPLAIASIPYGYVCESSGGLWRLGDQAAVIPSFAGEGMAIALHSAELAAQTILAQQTPAEFQINLAMQVRHQVQGATTLSRLMTQPHAQTVMSAALAAAPNLARIVARRTRLDPRRHKVAEPAGGARR